MAAPTGTHIRISGETNTSLKALAKKAPQFSASALADQFLHEACQSALGKAPASLPTVIYLRTTLGIKDPPCDNPIILQLLEKNAILERNNAELRAFASLRNEERHLIAAEEPPRTKKA